MNNMIAVGIILLISLILGWIKYGSLANQYKGSSWQLKFIEMWNCVVSFLITGLIGYYFVLIRWPPLLGGGEFKTSDLVIFVIFTMGLFGHLNVMSNNITKGIEAIIAKIYSKIHTL